METFTVKYIGRMLIKNSFTNPVASQVDQGTCLVSNQLPALLQCVWCCALSATRPAAACVKIIDSMIFQCLIISWYFFGQDLGQDVHPQQNVPRQQRHQENISNQSLLNSITKPPGIVSDEPILLDLFNPKFICKPLSSFPDHKNMACVLHNTPEWEILFSTSHFHFSYT